MVSSETKREEAPSRRPAKRTGRLVRARRVSQVVFLAAFLALFATVAYRAASPLSDAFLELDPLIALSTALSLRGLAHQELLAALPVVLLSLVLGRAFCGWICPMGTVIDLSERALRIRGRKPKDAPAWRKVKFYVLLALLVTMLLPVATRTVGQRTLGSSTGLAATYLVDPIAMLTRTVTYAAFPVVQWGANGAQETLLTWSYSDTVSRHPLLARALSPFSGSEPVWARSAYFRLGWLVFLMFAGLIALSTLARRFWCRNLCPLGALLGFLGKKAPVRLHVSDACVKCMRCVNECKTGAITEDPHVYRGPECIDCYQCVSICPKQAISVTAGPAREERDDAVRLDRRRVLGAAGVGLAAAVLPRVDWSGRPSPPGDRVLKVSGEALVRPPGSQVEPAFVSACVRCGECMAACPTNGLQPALGEGGLEALGTPILMPRHGACNQECNVCGQVCPAKAIEPFAIAEKKHLYMGTATVDRNRCIAWADGKRCVICDEACSYDAITQDTQNGIGRPVINAGICVGCGLCENVCPVEPRGAIHVSAGGDKRHLSRAEQQALREQAEATRTEGAGQESKPPSPYPGVG